MPASRAIRPLYVKQRTAARMMDMDQPLFAELVEVGVLPKPVDFMGRLRWRVADLDDINSGAAMDQEFEV